MISRTLLALFSLCLVPLTLLAKWPQNYVVLEKSASPDGKYGVLIPTMDASGGPATSLVDLKEQKLLGEIKGADYIERENHRGLSVLWADDSSWCVVEYDERFGFGTLSILEPKGGRFSQVEVGSRLTKAVGAVISKQSHVPESGADISLYYQTTSDRKLKVNGLATTNPKELEGQKSYYAVFSGLYDVSSNKWPLANARPIDVTQYNALDSAFGYHSGDALESLKTFTQEVDQASHLDEMLNGMYQAARFLLPPERFTKLKQEQIAWLKKRDAVTSTPEKFKFIAARIDEISELLP